MERPLAPSFAWRMASLTVIKHLHDFSPRLPAHFRALHARSDAYLDRCAGFGMSAADFRGVSVTR